MSKIIKQIKDRYKIDLECNGIKYELWAIDDTEYEKLHRDNSLPIADKSKFSSQIFLYQYMEQDNTLNLAELFTVLEWLFGDSSISYEYMKSSFYFHILLVIKRENGVFFYLLDISDSQGTMRIKLYKVVENTAISKYNNQSIYDPFTSEFSQSEISDFFDYFFGFLITYFQANKTVIARKNFLRTVRYNFILYGYKNGEYFEEGYETREIYREKIEFFEKICGVSLYERDVSGVLQAITNITSN